MHCKPLLRDSQFMQSRSSFSLTMFRGTSRSSGTNIIVSTARMAHCPGRWLMRNQMFSLWPRHRVSVPWNSCKAFKNLLSKCSISLHCIKLMFMTHRQACAPGVAAYDCQEREECLLMTFPLLIPADNPMQAEQCSQAGLTANKFCRTCTVGGPQAFKRSDEGYVSLFQVSTNHVALLEHELIST